MRLPSGWPLHHGGAPNVAERDCNELLVINLIPKRNGSYHLYIMPSCIAAACIPVVFEPARLAGARRLTHPNRVPVGKRGRGQTHPRRRFRRGAIRNACQPVYAYHARAVLFHLPRSASCVTHYIRVRYTR